MFTSISKQPIDLVGISVQIQATCEIWGNEPNFKYFSGEGHEKRREVNIWHGDYSLRSAAHTFIIHCAHMSMYERALNSSLTPFEIEPKS